MTPAPRDPPRPRTYRGAGIEVTFDASRCVHSGRCLLGLPDVFDLGARPWVDAEGASPDEIIETVARCPSGALTAARTDDGAEEEPVPCATVVAVRNGPLHVRGDLTIGIPGPDGTTWVRATRAALCRCGHSANKPFCDNSHLEARFRGGGLRELPVRATTEEPPPGPLRVRPRENGSLFLEGWVRLETEDGDAGWIDNVSLCRCGLSERRPLCDSSHKESDFAAPGAE